MIIGLVIYNFCLILIVKGLPPFGQSIAIILSLMGLLIASIQWERAKNRITRIEQFLSEIFGNKNNK